MPPTVGSSQFPTDFSLSSEEDKPRVKDANQQIETFSHKLRWQWRGLIWRVKLGVLPPITVPVEELRQAMADGRRRYAEFRRRLLVDPHLLDNGQSPPHDLSMDNPLSLNPDSVWGRFFRNVELERTIDKDLARLYPEHGSYFQGQSCQSMLRRVLLVWSLINPQCSYRQGMHELLAPFLYVLHVDLEKLSHMKGRYEDQFDEGFTQNSFQFLSTDLVEKSREISDLISQQDLAYSFKDMDESEADIAVILMGSDMYGAEGELGALLSGRFIEHDTYCMFDALMSGRGGAPAMAEYFLSSSGAGSSLAVPPIIEASSAVYRTLAAADVSLYAHFVELGVEPQFFSLRWLRLLFGREFLLEDLLLVWDAIFAASNQVFSIEPGTEYIYVHKNSPRSALIYALAVSMLLYLRPALLAAPDATGCLQRLLNFPQVSDLPSLIQNAKLLQPLAEASVRTPPPPIPRSTRLSELNRSGKHTRSGSISPPTSHGHTGLVKSFGLQPRKSTSYSPEMLRLALPESYWEERWKSSMLQRVLEDDSLCQQNEVAGTEVDNEQQEVTRSSDAVSGNEQVGSLAEDSEYSENAKGHLQEASVSYEIRYDEGANTDTDMRLASNGHLGEGSDVGASSSLMQMPEEKEHCETVDGLCGTKLTTECDKERMRKFDDLKDSTEGNGIDCVQSSGIIEQISYQQAKAKSVSADILSVASKPNSNSHQFNVDESVLIVNHSLEDGHLASQMRSSVARDNLAHSPLPSQYKLVNSFDCQNAAIAAESEQEIISKPSTSSNLENPSENRYSIHVPFEQGDAGISNTRNYSEATSSPTCQRTTSKSIESSSSLYHLQSRGTFRTLAWVSGLDKFNLGEKSVILKTAEQACLKDETSSCTEIVTGIVSTSALPLRHKYMWNPNNLESEANSSGSSDITSRLMESQAGACNSRKEPKNEVEAQCSLISWQGHSRDKGSVLSVQLQALGQSMLDHIKTLESTLVGKESTSDPTTDKICQNLTAANHNSRTNVASLVALAELRKISNFLRQL